MPVEAVRTLRRASMYKNNRVDIERAELIQSLQAYLIPSSLFVACLVMAAGTFLLYNRFSLGWAFVGLALVIMAAAFTAFFRFQNKLRAGGQIPDRDGGRAREAETPNASREAASI